MAASPQYAPQYPQPGNPYGSPYQSAPAVDVAGFMARVYRWMGLGLLLTGLVASAIAASPDVSRLIVHTPFLFYGVLIAELVMVWVFSSSVRKVSFGTAAAMFISYCALNGVTFSVFFWIYTRGSIATAFYVTGGAFAATSAYGTLTKRDLSGWGGFLFMALTGIILAAVVNLFVYSSMLSFGIAVLSVLVFTGLTAYETQKIRTWAAVGDGRLALAGALELYLDFINLFIAFLRLFGRRR